MASFLVVFCRFRKDFRAFHLNPVSTCSSIIYSNITRFCPSCGTTYNLGGESTTAEVVPMKLERSLPWKSWNTAKTEMSYYNGTCMVYTRYYRYSVPCLHYTNRSISKCTLCICLTNKIVVFSSPWGGYLPQGVTRNLCKFCTPVPQLELLWWVLHAVP